MHTGAAVIDTAGRASRTTGLSDIAMGRSFCDAYEAYLALHPDPQLTFEWAWNLYQSLVGTRELQLAWCAICDGPYVQDAYALDYQRCPFCELKDQPGGG